VLVVVIVVRSRPLRCPESDRCTAHENDHAYRRQRPAGAAFVILILIVMVIVLGRPWQARRNREFPRRT